MNDSLYTFLQESQTPFLGTLIADQSKMHTLLYHIYDNDAIRKNGHYWSGHMTNPSGHVINPSGHVTNPSGHVTNPSGHVINLSGHVTNLSDYYFPRKCFISPHTTKVPKES